MVAINQEEKLSLSAINPFAGAKMVAYTAILTGDSDEPDPLLITSLSTRTIAACVCQHPLHSPGFVGNCLINQSNHENYPLIARNFSWK